MELLKRHERDYIFRCRKFPQTRPLYYYDSGQTQAEIREDAIIYFGSPQKHLLVPPDKSVDEIKDGRHVHEYRAPIQNSEA